jgi:hypothetical protein
MEKTLEICMILDVPQRAESKYRSLNAKAVIMTSEPFIGFEEKSFTARLLSKDISHNNALDTVVRRGLCDTNLSEW